MGRIRIWIGLIFSLTIVQVYSQNDSKETDIRELARKAFSAKDYVRAFPFYQDLLLSYPKEPEYIFTTAVCIIKLNRNMDEAVTLLKSPAVSEYSPLVLFYLGQALHLNYTFDEAIKAYSKYLPKSKENDPSKEYVERLIEMARNGIDYTRSGNSIRVQNMETISSDQLQLATAINGTGRLMKKPVEFCNKTDVRNGYRPWMFLPSYTEINEYIYTAGYETGRKNGKQLFRIRNINHETWGIPEPLEEIINTPYDEEYPFFDRRTSTLYFSSNGHSSMGGYDIFSSVYNWNTKTWSQPKNLGFPINSPYDDFIYITDGFGSTVSFVSTRATKPGQVTIYRLKLEKDTTGIHYRSAEEMKKAALFELISEKPLQSKPGVVQNVEQNDSLPDQPQTKSVRNDYNKVLAEALQLQLRADSAARITRDLRIMAREIPEDSLKKQTVDDIIRSEKVAKSLQREADKKYAEARELRSSVITVQVDSAVALSKEVNGIRVYQYRPAGDQDKVIQNIPDTVDPVKTVQINSKPENPAKVDKFVILDQVAYSDINPIPQGLSTDTGLVYRVQLGVFSRKKPNESFGGISPVAWDYVPGTTMLKYYAGLFYTLNGVTKALESIRSLGFPDAFIVAFENGKPITTERAKEIEFAGFKL